MIDSMKTTIIFKLVAMVFISITSLLLILTIFNVTDASDTKDAIIKLAAASGIIAFAAIGLSLLRDNK